MPWFLAGTGKEEREVVIRNALVLYTDLHWRQVSDTFRALTMCQVEADKERVGLGCLSWGHPRGFQQRDLVRGPDVIL